MNPVAPPVVTCVFVAPAGQGGVQKISAYSNQIKTGELAGAVVIVTAWKPTEQDLFRLNMGAPIYLSVLGALPPHLLSTEFDEATYGIEDALP